MFHKVRCQGKEREEEKETGWQDSFIICCRFFCSSSRKRWYKAEGAMKAHEVPQ